MSRYNSNYGSHDQLRESRELGMQAARERDKGIKVIDELRDQIGALTYQIKDLEDELELAREALRRAFPENQQ